MTIAAQLLQSAKTGGKDEHNSPRDLLDRVRLLGPIVLDPCTSDENPTGAFGWFTPKHDGLSRSWADWLNSTKRYGLVYINSPYSTIAAWVDKMIAEAEASPRVPFIMLCAARTDTRWWRKAWAAADAVGLIRGRLTFGDAKSCAPFPSALFGLNVSQRRFRAAFADVAEVVIPC